MTVNELAIAAKSDTVHIGSLWEQVYGLVCMWANRYRIIDKPQYETDDLVQSAYFALVRAVEQYPEDSPYNFTTYLNYHCKNEFRSVIGIRSSKREPSLRSLDAPLTAEGDFSLVDTVTDEAAANDFFDVENKVYNEQLHNALEAAMISLPEHQRFVLKTHYYECKTLKEIAEILKCNDSYPRSMKETALRTLRRGKAMKRLRDFEYGGLSIQRTGYNAFKNDMQSSVERVVMKKLELEERYRNVL